MINKIDNDLYLRSINKKFSWFYLILLPLYMLARFIDSSFPTEVTNKFLLWLDASKMVIFIFPIITLIVFVLSLINLFNKPRLFINILAFILSTVVAIFYIIIHAQ